MDFQTAFNIVLTAFGGLVGWLLNVLYSNMRDLTEADQLLSDKVQGIEVLVAGNYVKRSEFEVLISKIEAKLDRIEDKIDRTADKVK